MANSLLNIFHSSPLFIKNMVSSARGYQLKYWRNRHRGNYLKMLIEREAWTSEHYIKWQEGQLKELLGYAVLNVPYYRNLWDKLKVEEPGKNHLNLTDWPILEKDSIRSSMNLFVSDKFKKNKLYSIHTSGTSGKPMHFLFTRASQSLWYAMYERRIRQWNGVSDKEPYGNFGGKIICAPYQNKPPFWVWNGPQKQLYFSSYHIREHTAPYYMEAIKKYSLTHLWGYVSSIYSLALYCERLHINAPRMKLIITNAEPLYQPQRELISKVFKCPVIQTYSGSEYAFGGSEDLSGTLYLWPEAGILEVLKQDGAISDSGTGEFLATGFANLAMPLVRYRLGDTGTISEPPPIGAGRNMKYLSEVTGRTDDLIITPEGKRIGRLDPVFKADIAIKECQIIQHTINTIELKIVPDPGFSDNDKHIIMERLKERIGEDIIVSVTIAEAIPRGANGKFKSVISKLDQH